MAAHFRQGEEAEAQEAAERVHLPTARSLQDLAALALPFLDPVRVQACLHVRVQAEAPGHRAAAVVEVC